MTEALIHDAVRTPRGKGRRGALHSVKPVAPAAGLLRALAERNRLDTAAVDDVVRGVVPPVGERAPTWPVQRCRRPAGRYVRQESS